jgi:hypothetical protein
MQQTGGDSLDPSLTLTRTQHPVIVSKPGLPAKPVKTKRTQSTCQALCQQYVGSRLCSKASSVPSAVLGPMENN